MDFTLYWLDKYGTLEDQSFVLPEGTKIQLPNHIYLPDCAHLDLVKLLGEGPYDIMLKHPWRNSFSMGLDGRMHAVRYDDDTGIRYTYHCLYGGTVDLASVMWALNRFCLDRTPESDLHNIL